MRADPHKLDSWWGDRFLGMGRLLLRRGGFQLEPAVLERFQVGQIHVRIQRQLGAIVREGAMTISVADSRHFSLDQATASLPLVSSILADLVELSNAMVTRRELLSQVKEQRSKNELRIYDEELQDVEDCLKADAERLKSYVEELADLGVHVRSIPDGVVGFPSVLKGRQVYLSWKLGEPQIAYWHGQDEGFENRRPFESSTPNRMVDSTISSASS